MFNGLIALEEAASGNAVTAGAGGWGGVCREKYRWETLSATRESRKISLMGGGEELCRMSDTFCSPVSAPPPPSSSSLLTLPTPLHSTSSTTSYLSQLAPAPPPVVNYTKSHIARSLLGK